MRVACSFTPLQGWVDEGDEGEEDDEDYLAEHGGGEQVDEEEDEQWLEQAGKLGAGAGLACQPASLPTCLSACSLALLTASPSALVCRSAERFNTPCSCPAGGLLTCFPP